MSQLAIIKSDRLATAVPRNHWLGWTLMMLGLALTAALAPWLFGRESRLDAVYGITSAAAMYALGVVLRMALLQLVVGLVLNAALARTSNRIPAWLTAIGALLYVGGAGLGLWWPVLHGLMLAGSLFNLAGCCLLLQGSVASRVAIPVQAMLAVICFGLLLDVATALALVFPAVVPVYLSDSDGVRVRMLRLARIAAIALPALALLYRAGVLRRGDGQRYGEWAFLAGAVGMPVILATACFTSVHVKFLLPLPACAVLGGVFVALGGALRDGSFFERWGWLLIAISLSVGMLMGLYAFNGPLPTPAILGEYTQWERSLSRMAHGYCIVLGMVSLFLSGAMGRSIELRGAMRLGAALFAVGSAVAVAAITASILYPLPGEVVSASLVATVLGAGACLAIHRRQD